MKTVVRFRKKNDQVSLPQYETAGSAGADIRACLTEEVTIRPGEHVLIPTGLFPEIPEGFEIQVRPRSGLAFKRGITVLNTPGTVDSDYRGEICVNLINLGTDDYVVSSGDRIAQIVVSPVYRFSFIEADTLTETVRGEGGFGSTGV